MEYKRILTSIGIALILGFLAFIISDIGFAVFLLILYIEFRRREE